VLSQIITLAFGATAATFVWYVHNWIARPTLQARDRRLQALDAVENNGLAGGTAPQHRIREAREALNAAASGLRTIARGHGLPTRIFCLAYRCNFELATSAIVNLRNMTGNIYASNDARHFNIDAAYYYLGAGRHLSQARIKEIKDNPRLAMPEGSERC
jgi:hypothetical protein